MQTVNIHEAKTHYSRLVDAVARGEEIIIAKAGKPCAKLVPINPVKPRRIFGSMQGQIKIADDFDAPLSDDMLSLFEGK